MENYCAFISYRHISPDMEIAGKLHTMIENYTIPRNQRGNDQDNSQRHLGKVFRDQEELPLSADLSKDIEEALDHSDWLICICTPSYLESRWCMRELEYFIEKHGRKRVLAVLAEGEPKDSFPDALCHDVDENGNVIDLEPLAADVRGESIHESLKKLKKEKLRILAPMLGVSFDSLYQRQKRRNLQRGLLGISVAAVLLGGFLAYSLVQNNRINAQRIEASQNACDLLVEKSVYYTSVYRKAEAREMALNAHSVSGTIDDYGDDRIVEALARTCYLGDFAVEAKLDITPGAAVYTTDYFSPDGSKIVEAVSANTLVCCDAVTGQRLWEDKYDNEITSVRWKQDGSEIVVTSEWSHILRVLAAETGEKLYELYIPWVINGTYIGDEIYICFSQGIIRWNPLDDPDGSEEIPYVMQCEESQHHSSQTIGGGRFIVLENEEATYSTFFVADTETGNNYVYQTPFYTTVLGYTVSPEGDRFYIHQYGKAYVCELATDEILWEEDIENDSSMPISIMHNMDPVWAGGYIFDNAAYSPDGTEGLCRVFYAEAMDREDASSADGQTQKVGSDGQLLATIEGANCICVLPGEEYFLCTRGLYRMADLQCVAHTESKIAAADQDFEHYITVEAGYIQVAVARGSQYPSDTYDGTIYKETNPEHYLVSSDEKYYVVVNEADKCVHLVDLEASSKDDELINLSDPATKQSVIRDLDLGSQPSRTMIVFSPDNTMVALGCNLGNVAVYELESGKEIYAYDDLYMRSALAGLTFNKDGTCLLVADYQQKVFCVFSVETGDTLYEIHALKDVSDWGFDDATGDAVIKYEDGSAIFGNIFTTPEELYSYAEGL